MPAQGRQRVSIAPFRGVNSRHAADRTLGGTYMRGAYNFELRDGEWWTRQGESRIGGVKVGSNFGPGIRYASTPWWWMFDVNRDVSIIANAYWALAINASGSVSPIYTPAVTENMQATLGSAAAISTSPRSLDQLIIVGGSDSKDVYRVKALGAGNNLTLDRPWEQTSTGGGGTSCAFLDSLTRTTAGAAASYVATTDGAWTLIGSCFVFEQLVTHAANALYAGAPALTAGHYYLVIVSNLGVPVAIDLSTYVAGGTAVVARQFFFNTALAAPTVIGSNSFADNLKARGVWGDVYKGRVFLGAATDPNGAYGSRTLWYSQIGDLGLWHTGISGQTATPNFKTFDGEGNAICEVKTLADSLVIHRQDTQEVCDATGSLAQPFIFRTVSQDVGMRAKTQTNTLVKVRGRHFFWSMRGPVVFDGQQLQMVATDAYAALAAYGVVQGIGYMAFVLHDALRHRIYWYGKNMGIHQDALPAFASITLASGDVVDNYVGVFVYDYDNDDSWFEYRPNALGGGMVKAGVTTFATPKISRYDGSVLAVVASSGQQTGGDAAYLTPEISGPDVSVNCQADTPWMDFGSPYRKQINEVETAVRALTIGESDLDQYGGLFVAGHLFLRLRTYVDMDRSTARADVGVKLNSDTATPLLSKTDFAQAPQALLRFTPNVWGMRFKFCISNALSAAAVSDGTYVQGPIRLSDLMVDYAQKDSSVPLTDVTAASIST